MKIASLEKHASLPEIKIEKSRRKVKTALILCMVSFIARSILGFSEGPWYVLATQGFADMSQLAVYLTILQSRTEDKHRDAMRSSLIWLISAKSLFLIMIIFYTPPISYIIGAITGPLPWVFLLVGLSHRKSISRPAITMQTINAISPIMLIAINLILLALPTGSEFHPPHAIREIFKGVLGLVRDVCLLIVLRNWPVLEKPILQSKLEKANASAAEIIYDIDETDEQELSQ